MENDERTEENPQKPARRELRPLLDFVLLTIPPKVEKVTAGGIAIPESDANCALKLGIVQSLGPKVPVGEHGPERELRPGQWVLFNPQHEETMGIGEDRVLVPFPAIMATLHHEDASDDSPTSALFQVPPWEEFVGDDYEKWERFQNLTLFSLRVNFLEPFEELKELAKRTHECCVQSLRGLPDLDLGSIRYVVRKDDMVTAVHDDVWHGLYIVNPKASFIEFQKPATDVPGVQKTCPRMLSALASTFASQEFRRVAGEDYSRVTCVVFRFHQTIRIEGRGSNLTDATNSELMRQFLLFGQTGDKLATLDALAAC